MPTRVLDAYSKAYPAIENRIRAAVYSESDPMAIVASIIDANAGHPERIWHFPGLPNDNYKFSLDEIDGDDNPINNLALFDVVPGNIDGLLTRKDEQIIVDTTPGFNAGENNFIFDGTDGKPDYRGWDIVPSELDGRGILKEGLDYSWDEETGTFVLLQSGDLFQSENYYNIHFEPAGTTSVPNSVPTVFDFSQRVVTATGNITVNDFGNSIICEPGGEYIELTLPDIATVARGRVLSIEVTAAAGIASLSCVKIITNGTVGFPLGIYLNSGDSIQIYKLRRDDDSTEWRLRYEPFGLLQAGMSIGHDIIQTGTFNCHLFDGASESVFKYARIYNNYVLRLPASQRVNYDSWSTGNNKYLWSAANSANPANANKFHFPDRRNLFERNNDGSGKAGDFQTDWVNITALRTRVSIGNSFTGAPGSDWLAVAPRFGRGLAGPNEYFLPLSADVGAGTGSETRPKSTLINKYCLV